MKKIVALLLSVFLAAHLTACTSSDSVEESDSLGGDETTASVDGELEKVEGEAPSDVAASDGAADPGFLDEQLPEDALGESTTDQAANTPPPADTGTTSSEPELSLDEPLAEAPATDVASQPPADDGLSTPPPLESPVSSTETLSEPSNTDIAGVGGSEATPTEEAPKPMPSYRKAETVPFKRSGVLLNAIYVSRPGDSFKSVAKMIYGDEAKQKELKKVNPALGSLKTGDKVYYNSPTRPADDQKIASYYEDMGMAPEVYVSKEGDDLKVVSKDILGFPGAWKELYALNSVESKGTLDAGTELRYWKSPPPMPEMPTNQMSPPAEVAMNTPPPEMNEAAAPPAMPDMPPPPPPVADMPPPPPPPVAEAAPPPPPPDMPPPPPPEPVAPPPPKKMPNTNIGAVEGMDNDMMMTLGAAGILLIGVASIVVVRKRRQQREMAAAFNDTQVGT